MGYKKTCWPDRRTKTEKEMKIWKLKTVMTVRVNKVEACANWFNPFTIFKQLFPGPWFFQRNSNHTPGDKKNIRYFYIKMRLCNQFSAKVSPCHAFLMFSFQTMSLDVSTLVSVNWYFSFIFVLKSNSDSPIYLKILKRSHFGTILND